MSKGNKKQSNREAKKPKQIKEKIIVTADSGKSSKAALSRMKAPK
mgnify:CR=1 FL=1|jgi:hypothetical protein